MKLIIQVPCYNEAQTLEIALNHLPKHIDGIDEIESLILASILMLMGFQTGVIGLLADIIAANRKILEDVQYHARKLDYDREKEEK